MAAPSTEQHLRLLGSVISAARAQRGFLTATAAAETDDGISPSTWLRIENGEPKDKSDKGGERLYRIASPESYCAVDRVLGLKPGTTACAAASKGITLEEYAAMVEVELPQLVARLEIRTATEHQLAAMEDLAQASALHDRLLRRTPGRRNNVSAEAGRKARRALADLIDKLEDEIDKLTLQLNGENTGMQFGSETSETSEE